MLGQVPLLVCYYYRLLFAIICCVAMYFFIDIVLRYLACYLAVMFVFTLALFVLYHCFAAYCPLFL
jgi:hypothetical protein